MGLLNEFLAERSKKTQEEERLLSIPDIDSLSLLTGLAEAKRNQTTDGTFSNSPFSEGHYAEEIAKAKGQIMSALKYSVPQRARLAKIEPTDFYLTQFLPHERGAWIFATKTLAKFQNNIAVAGPLLKHYLKFCSPNNFEDAIRLVMMAGRGYNVPQIDAVPQDVINCLVVREEIPKLEQEGKQLEEKIADVEKDLNQRVVKEVIAVIDGFGRPESLEQAWAGIKGAPVTNTMAVLKQLESYIQSYASVIKSEHDTAIKETEAMLGEYKGKVANTGRKISFLFGKPAEVREEIPEGLKKFAGKLFELTLTMALTRGEAGITDLADLLSSKKTFQIGDEVIIVKTYYDALASCGDPDCDNHPPAKYFWGGTRSKLPVKTTGIIKRIYAEGSDTCIELDLGDKHKGTNGRWSVHPDEVELAGGIKKLFADAAKEIKLRSEAQKKGLDVEQLYRENNIKVGTLKELRKAMPALIYEKCSEGNSGRILDFVRNNMMQKMLNQYKIGKEDLDYFMAGKSATVLKNLETRFIKELREGQPEMQLRLSNLNSLLENCNKYVKQFEA
ncbi:MAG: hypothetical protein HY438_04435 [DPANN group archaeon]|nr:hypothetical protein [DPANN group archaeon]